MEISQQDTDIRNEMKLLLSELHDLLMNNRQQLDQTGMKENVDKVLEWAKRADDGSNTAEYMLEQEGIEILKHVRDCLKLTGRGYMVFQNESSTIAPPQEPDPQTFFLARDRLIEIIDSVLKLKIKHKENEVSMDNFDKKIETVHEVVGVFNNADSLQSALDELQEHGFMHQELSILADARIVEEKLGHVYKRVQDVEDDPEAPRTIFIPNETIGEAEGSVIGLPLYIAAVTAAGIVAASGGTLLTLIAATAGAGVVGASIGSIFANIIAKHHADFIQSQIDHGGLLLWVHLRSPDLEKKAKEILKKNSAQDVHVHEIPIYG